MNYYTNTLVSSEQPVISNSAFNFNLARNLKPNKSAVFDNEIINSIQL